MDSQQLYMMQMAAARHPKPSRDRQLGSVVFSVVHVILAAVALSQSHWSSYDGVNEKFYGLFNVDSSQTPIAGSIVFFILLGIVCSVASSIASLGYPRQKGACFRHNSVGNVIAVITTVMVCGFWYWLLHDISGNNIRFGYCFYLMVAAGTSSVAAVGFNLFLSKPKRRSHQRSSGRSYAEPLSISAEDSAGLLSPPAYSP
ncbi:uncharacterized protein [Oscarella lobularis]|uniref:uncharacterized protein n=1 Tax=Oscarella lobularis TaxID=121494 RepID=UPI003313120F